MKPFTQCILTALCMTFIATSACQTNGAHDSPAKSNSPQISLTPAPEQSPAQNPEPTQQSATPFDEFIEQFITIQAETHCRNAFECPAPNLGDFSVERLGRLRDQKSCVEYLKTQNLYAQSPRNLAILKESIAAGRAKFNPKRAKSCLTAYKNYGANCAYPSPEIDINTCNERSIKDVLKEECREIILPLVASDFGTNNECTNSLECIQGYCYTDTPQGNSSKICHEWEARCDDVMVGGIGEQCAPGDCNNFLFCGTNKKCQVMKTSRENEQCSDDNGPLCQTGLYCAPTKKCAVLPTYGAINASCNELDKRCNAGLACSELKPGPNNTFTGTCKPIRNQYDKCQQNHECPPDLYCNGTIHKPGICIPARNLGQSCSTRYPLSNYMSDCGDAHLCSGGYENSTCEKRFADDPNELDQAFESIGADPFAS